MPHLVLALEIWRQQIEIPRIELHFQQGDLPSSPSPDRALRWWSDLAMVAAGIIRRLMRKVPPVADVVDGGAI